MPAAGRERLRSFRLSLRRALAVAIRAHVPQENWTCSCAKSGWRPPLHWPRNFTHRTQLVKMEVGQRRGGRGVVPRGREASAWNLVKDTGVAGALPRTSKWLRAMTVLLVDAFWKKSGHWWMVRS